MPDPHGFDDDPVATRMEFQSTRAAEHLDQTRMEDQPTGAKNVDQTREGDQPIGADRLEATEIDPYATAMPVKPAKPDQTSLIADGMQIVETVEDPYATRFVAAGHDSIGTVGSLPTEQWQESGG